RRRACYGVRGGSPGCSQLQTTELLAVPLAAASAALVRSEITLATAEPSAAAFRSSCVGTSNGIALALSNMQSNIFATSNKHGMQQQKYRAPRRPRNLSLWARAGRDDGRRSPASAASRGRAPLSPYHSNFRSQHLSD